MNLIVENSTLGCRDTVNKEVNIDQFVFIPNIVTPNGDGKNEKFVINGILGECWILTVYNRYGKLVYKNEKYQNDWNPSSLSDGVYFYGLENNLSSREFKGYITVIR